MTCEYEVILMFFDVVIKGLGADMLKTKAVRRRTKAQVKADKAAAAQKEKDAAKAKELLVQLQQDPKEV